MMLIRAELYCHGWPDGNIPHGHVDVKVRGDSRDWSGCYNRALDVMLCQLERSCWLGEETCYVDFELLEERSDEFDNGDVYGTIVGGEGEALDFNPVSKLFFADYA